MYTVVQWNTWGLPTICGVNRERSGLMCVMVAMVSNRSFAFPKFTNAST